MGAAEFVGAAAAVVGAEAAVGGAAEAAVAAAAAAAAAAALHVISQTRLFVRHLAHPGGALGLARVCEWHCHFFFYTDGISLGFSPGCIVARVCGYGYAHESLCVRRGCSAPRGGSARRGGRVRARGESASGILTSTP